MTDKHRIECLFLSQEDLLQAGCLDIRLAMSAAENAMLAYQKNDILFPEKVVQIFNEDTQERINCLPATLLPEKICGAKWVSVFPFNPEKYGQQNLSAVFILSEIEKGYPIAFVVCTKMDNSQTRTFTRTSSKSSPAKKEEGRPPKNGPTSTQLAWPMSMWLLHTRCTNEPEKREKDGYRASRRP